MCQLTELNKKQPLLWSKMWAGGGPSPPPHQNSSLGVCSGKSCCLDAIQRGECEVQLIPSKLRWSATAEAAVTQSQT